MSQYVYIYIYIHHDSALYGIHIFIIYDSIIKRKRAYSELHIFHNS